MPPFKSLLERANAVRLAGVAEARRAAAYLLAAQTAVGPQGTLDDQLVRLMVWVGTFLPHGDTHSQLTHPIEILDSGIAWCDQHARVLAWGAKELFGLPGRLLQLKHTDGESGHMVCEILYDGTWHLFDADSRHLSCYRDAIHPHVLGFDDLQKIPGVVAAHHHWWRGKNGIGMEGFFALEPIIYGSWEEKRVRSGS